jgi:hypothetical protein
MRLRHAAILSLTCLLLILAVTSESYAAVSNAAVLFLRIAPGARAAGMGEAFVAVADDATATHYNPAGLGSYPLTDAWVDAKIPAQYRPIKAIAAIKARGGTNYMAYDLWAITPKGLLRYDNKKWQEGELFRPRTDQTVDRIVSQYFGIDDDSVLARVVSKVAVANNRGSLESLTSFRDSVMAVIPKDYSGLTAMQAAFDSLISCYDQCRLNWDQIGEAKKLFAETKKDSAYAERELDRLSFAVEKGRNRFVPEEITLPYAAYFEGDLTSIASTGDMMLVGTSNGLIKYTGKVWQRLDTEAGLPSNNILCLGAYSNVIYIGTDMGPARFNGLTVEPFDPATGAPQGKVTAIAANSTTDVWAVIDNDVYHSDGLRWSNDTRYVVLLDDTPQSIAAKFSLYGTPEDQASYLSKFDALNPQLAESVAKAEPPVADSTVQQIPQDSSQATSSDPAPQDSSQVVPADPAPQAAPAGLKPGDTITVPFMAGFKGEVTSIGFGRGRVWFGTEYGVVYFDKDHWGMPGYRTSTLTETRAVSDIEADRKAPTQEVADAYDAALHALNDISGDSVQAGTSLKVYGNPASAPVRELASVGDRVMFATADGLLEYDGIEWGRADLKGLGAQQAEAIETIHDEAWFAGENEIVTKAKGRPEVSMMYVKWLPSLANDLYYAYLSGVVSTNGWGTFGGNITYISYGTFVRVSEQNYVLGEFSSFDVAFTASYGASLTNALKAGVSAKIIYSRLSDQGAGNEKGKGTSTGFALDVGLLWHATPRLNFGLAVTNLGPKMAYIDAAQADDLPRNLAFGFAYKILQTEYTRLLFTAEANKLLVGSFTKDIATSAVYNTGAEFVYANLIALRAGYIYDQEGKIKLFTIGAGLDLLNRFKFDFAYIPSQSDSPLNNILRLSMSAWL